MPIKCQQCGQGFEKGRKDRPTRRFCSRDCYRLSMRKFDERPYPQVWHEGRREYLHRVIYMKATGETLGPNDIIHHKDHNPFNREPSNLEKKDGRLEHLRSHNFHRDWKQKRGATYDAEIGF